MEQQDLVKVRTRRTTEDSVYLELIAPENATVIAVAHRHRKAWTWHITSESDGYWGMALFGRPLLDAEQVERLIIKMVWIAALMIQEQ